MPWSSKNKPSCVLASVRKLTGLGREAPARSLQRALTASFSKGLSRRLKGAFKFNRGVDRSRCGLVDFFETIQPHGKRFWGLLGVWVERVPLHPVTRTIFGLHPESKVCTVLPCWSLSNGCGPLSQVLVGSRYHQNATGDKFRICRSQLPHAPTSTEPSMDQ